MIHLGRLDTAAALSLVLASAAPGVGCSRAAEELKQKAIGAATHAVSEKVGEKVNEVVAEKMLSTALEKDGMKNVQTDFGKNGNKLSLTDKDGKSVSYASGDAVKLTEADFGVPFYPGAKLDDSKTMKIVSGNQFQYTVHMDTAEKLDKVSAFYRDKLKAIAGKRQYNEVADGTENVSFMLADESKTGYLMVAVEAPAGENTSVTLALQGQKPAAAK